MLISSIAFCDTLKIDRGRFYRDALNADLKSASNYLSTFSNKLISKKDSAFLKKFEELKKADRPFPDRDTEIEELLKIYGRYWKQALMEPSNNYDSLLIGDVCQFLGVTNRDSVHRSLITYIESKGLKTTGMGRTGKLLDLLVWKSEKDTTFSFLIGKGDSIKVDVRFMFGFRSLGWEEFATLGRAYPGGWATSDKLFCVREAYNINSESFLISYLCHEGRHFKDFKLYPGLDSKTLEYRAKLTELALLKVDLFKILGSFISYSAKDGLPHAAASYQVISDLSQKLFGETFVNDIERWRSKSVAEINSSAAEILNINTNALSKK